MDSRVVVVAAEDEGVISFRFVEEDGSFVVVVFVVVVVVFFRIYSLFSGEKLKSGGENFILSVVPAVADARDDDDKVKNTHIQREDGQCTQRSRVKERGGGGTGG